MQGLVAELRRRAGWHARRAVLAGVGAGLIAVGLGFLVAALWITLAPELGPAGVSLALGGAFLGLGLTVVALRGAVRPPPVGGRAARPGGHPGRAAAAQGVYRPAGDFPPVLEAFLLGVSVYLEMRGRRG